MLRVLGIDPGHSGALAVLDWERNKLAGLTTIAMPIVQGQKKHVDGPALAKFVRDHAPAFAVVEDVYSSPQMGVVSAFSFGEGKGRVLGVLEALGVPIRLVFPARWKGDLGATADKNQTKRLARMLLHTHASNLTSEGRCEAALIALWGILADPQTDVQA